MRFLIKPFAILLVKYLQWKYKRISINNRYRQSNRVLAKLILIQSILYYFKSQFNPWGYFHPSCVTNDREIAKYDKLFPQKEDFEELDIVVWHNPEAVIYYQHKIWKLAKGKHYSFHKEIKKQLIQWEMWN